MSIALDRFCLIPFDDRHPNWIKQTVQPTPLPLDYTPPPPKDIGYWFRLGAHILDISNCATPFNTNIRLHYSAKNSTKNWVRNSSKSWTPTSQHKESATTSDSWQPTLLSPTSQPDASQSNHNCTPCEFLFSPERTHSRQNHMHQRPREHKPLHKMANGRLLQVAAGK